MNLALSDEEKRTLLRIARGTIVSMLCGEGSTPAGGTRGEEHGQSRGQEPAPEAGREAGPALQQPCGAFVTLHERLAGSLELRGCIGYLETASPLAQTVRRAALAAAFHDARFSPVTAADLPRLEIEVSVLSPLAKVRDVGEIVVGEHGIVVRRGMRSGLLLPQVAVERRWDRDTFLEHTCLKAGLPRGAWRDADVTIEMFSALVFNEAELGILD